MQHPSDVSDDRSLRLPPHGSTTTAEDLRVRLVLAADFDGEMAIDASEVESVGSDSAKPSRSIFCQITEATGPWVKAPSPN